MIRKLISTFLILMLCVSLAVCVSAADSTLTIGTGPLMIDEADLLTHEEEADLVAQLQTISDMYQAQVNVVTLPEIDGDVEIFANQYYDDQNLGYGPDRDGVLLIICMNPRRYHIIGNGFCAQAIDVDTIDVIGNLMVTDLSDGNYKAALDIFVDECAYYMDGYINGFPFEFGANLIISLVIGIVVGLIVGFSMKAQLKSVRAQYEADAYIKAGSMQLTQSGDYFMYRNVTRTQRQQSSSSSSSRSGSSRSSGGGSF